MTMKDARRIAIHYWAEKADNSGRILNEACNGLATGILDCIEDAGVPEELQREVYSVINDNYIIDRE